MRRADSVGYIAVSRSIFDHPLLKDRPDWHVAWEKLIAAAAWRPRGQAGRWGSVHLERGQLAGTVRQLATLLGWPRSTVPYFLGKLTEQRMIECVVSRTRTNTRNGGKNSQRITVITICNYDKFQRRRLSENRRVGQEMGQGVGQEMPLLPGIIDENTTEEQINQRQQQSQEARKVRLLDKPRDGAISKDKRWVWYDYHSHGWEQYAADWQDVRRALLLPEQRLGGWGNWFYLSGEALRPPDKRKRRQKAA